jgi:hypothetical protein
MFLLLGWGRTGHSFINSNATAHLPESMQGWANESTFFGSHASDADSRKGSDPSEGPKHYIDLELYPNYQDLSDNLDSLVSALGSTAVNANGTLPWATRTAYDSLVAQLKRDDWEKAKLTASDIGHYVGDGHQPLHNTDNYNGQLSGNDGIHSRYESQMINAYQSELAITPASVSYVADVFAFVLAQSILANSYVDSIMIADDSAKVVSGWNGSGTPPSSYYETLWMLTRDLTLLHIQRSTEAIASLWFSAAVDAGTITSVGTGNSEGGIPRSLRLYQNYPNPFNPSTTIRFATEMDGPVRLSIHDLTGRAVMTFLEASPPSGDREITFDASKLSGGMYIYKLHAHGQEVSKKMVLLK